MPNRRDVIQAKQAERAKMTAQEVRVDIRNYIQNDRDTILRKWMALEEAVKSEDYRRDNFFKRKLREDTKKLPVAIQKFIGTLKRAVRKTMRDKGGTPYSIVRAMFLYWDADKSGEISSDELKGCMHSLGVKMTDAERDEVVKYYDSGNRQEGITDIEMTYTELLEDLSRGEPTMIEDSSNVKTDGSDIAMRYEEVLDLRPPLTKTISQFLEATRYWVMFRMRVEGSTPHYHIRNLFQFYDYDYSNGLNWKELMKATTKGMKLSITEAQAREIVNYYDFPNNGAPGDMQYQDFLNDVATFVQPVLHFTDVTPEERQKAIQSLKINPFMPVPFKAPPNKSVENFKRRITIALQDKVNYEGGTIVQWLKEAFIYWDRNYTQRISDWRVIQGVAKRLHVVISKEDCEAIIRNYDMWGTGEMHYLELLKDMTAEEGSFLTEPDNISLTSVTSRTPNNVEGNLKRFRQCVYAYSKKSGGILQPRDVLHGTFLRFDPRSTGKVDLSGLTDASKELLVTLTSSELNDLVTWFDTDGSRRMDYNAFTAQLFGEDIMTRTLHLPKLHKLAGSATFNLSSTYKGTDNIESGGDCSMNKKTMLVESQKAKILRLNAKRNIVQGERKSVVSKLKTIDQQKEAIIAQYKARHQEAREAYKRPPPQIFGNTKTQKAPSSSNTATLTTQNKDY
jgi:Ca2+-binding EF-hand superfamily protein